MTDDPVLENAIGEFRSATVAPIRLPDGDFWVIGLRKSNDLSETDLRGQMWIQALLVRSVSAQNWTRWARDERDLYDRELRAVARLQRSLLPIIPARSGFEIAASYETCTQAGGDHYDILQLPSGELAFLIADVSGHGAAAATGTALLHATFHAYTGSDFDPAMVLNWIDCQITQYLLEGSFITAFLGVLNPVNGHIVYGSAGHCPPYLRSAKGRIEVLSEAGGLPLGIAGSYEGGKAQTTLEEGDALVMYTDGVTEARNPSGQMFATAGLENALKPEASSAQRYVDRLVADLMAHMQESERDDDQTIVVIRRNR